MEAYLDRKMRKSLRFLLSPNNNGSSSKSPAREKDNSRPLEHLQSIAKMETNAETKAETKESGSGTCGCTRITNYFKGCGHTFTIIVNIPTCKVPSVCMPMATENNYQNACQSCAPASPLPVQHPPPFTMPYFSDSDDDSIYSNPIQYGDTNVGEDEKFERKVRKLQKSLTTLTITEEVEKVFEQVKADQAAKIQSCVKEMVLKDLEVFNNAANRSDKMLEQVKTAITASGECVAFYAAEFIDAGKRQVIEKCEEGVYRMLDALL